MKNHRLFGNIQHRLKRHESIIQIVLNISMLVISIIAIIFSIHAYNKANLQFETNSNKADSLFNIQLYNEKKLNDSIVANLYRLQKITNDQLQITDQQLHISTQSLKDQIDAGRPIVSFMAPEIEDEDKMIDSNTTAPHIIFPIVNVGKRYAVNLTERIIYISNNFKEIRFNDAVNIILKVAPNDIISLNYLPKFQNLSFPYFFVTEIQYSDPLTDKLYSDIQYYNVDKIRGKITFTFCEEVNSDKLKAILDLE